MITVRQRRLVSLALRESFKSSYDRVQIGAVVARRSKVVSTGANQRRGHPLQKLYNDKAGRLAPAHACHAEMHAIINSRDSIEGTDVYVGRWDRNGRLAMCRPCVACALALRDFGVQSVTYTTPKGIAYEVII